ncbi:MAG: M23 family metallopeptidase [Candidatus Nomurabacteria bacterium]
MLVINTKKDFRNGIFGLIICLAILKPGITHAGVLSDFTDKVKSIFLPTASAVEEVSPTSQTMALMKPVVIDDNDVNGAIADDTSSPDLLSATTGSLRVSTEDVDFPTNDTISVYEVKKGDSLAAVAKLFGVSKNTIMWANDLKSQNISPGDTLVILPMTGIKHVVKKGDNVSSIARKYKADANDIAKFNGITTTDSLTIGDTILVPEGELAITNTVKTSSGKIIITGKISASYSNSAPEGFLTRPLIGGRKTQGLHGRNGLDFGASIGTPVYSSAEGRVILAKMGGYNGGYGNYIIISHDNNIQTVYGHLSQINVVAGQSVSQGQIIGKVGNTGRSTGPHLHFEVRGARNPF